MRGLLEEAPSGNKRRLLLCISVCIKTAAAAQQQPKFKIKGTRWTGGAPWERRERQKTPTTSLTMRSLFMTSQLTSLFGAEIGSEAERCSSWERHSLIGRGE